MSNIKHNEYRRTYYHNVTMKDEEKAEEHKLKMKNYRTNNKEYFMEKRREYLEKDPEYYRRANSKYQGVHRESYLKKQRDLYTNNNQYYKDYYINNKQKILLAMGRRKEIKMWLRDFNV